MTFMDLRNKFISVVYFSQPGLGTVAAAVYFFGGGGGSREKAKVSALQGYKYVLHLVI